VADLTARIDIPCDVHQVDETGHVWTFLDHARDASVVTPGAIVISADEDDPVLARVVDVVPEPSGTIVHLEILPGDPLEYAAALSRAHLLPA
jgi:hypothetical protein